MEILACGVCQNLTHIPPGTALPLEIQVRKEAGELHEKVCKKSTFLVLAPKWGEWWGACVEGFVSRLFYAPTLSRTCTPLF